MCSVGPAGSMAWGGCCRGAAGHSPGCAVPAAAPTPVRPSALPAMCLLPSHGYIWPEPWSQSHSPWPFLGAGRGWVRGGHNPGWRLCRCRLNPGGSVSVPDGALCSSLTILGFLGSGLPVPSRSATQQFGLLPLSSGGGTSIQALSLFAQTHGSGGAAGECRGLATPPHTPQSTSCPSPWQLTADVWGGGSTGPRF